MRNSLVVILVVILLGGSFSSFAALQAHFDCKTFLNPNQGSYLETHLNMVGGTMTYALNEKSESTAKIEVLLMIKDGSNIIDYEKVVLESPAALDSTYVDFMDVRRFNLVPGVYQLELELLDLNLDTAEPVTYLEAIEIPDYKDMSISDISQLSAWSKTTTPNDLSRSGYDMLPRVSKFYDGDANKMGLYCELYHTDLKFGDGGSFALVTYFENDHTGKVVDQSMSIKKMKATQVIPVFQTKNLEYLFEGYYKMIVEIRNTQNQTVSSQSFEFIKQVNVPEIGEDYAGSISNTFVSQFTDQSVLYDHIKSLAPKAESTENVTINFNLSDETDLEVLKGFFFNFWYKRNPANPELEWNKYYQMVLATDKEFGTRVKKGYETERGRVYLQYGPSNTRVVRHNDTGAYPYEIWHYYRAGNFSNKRFVFLNGDLSSNDFILIQSDVPGEIKNANWVDMIQTNFQTNRIDSNGDDPDDSTSSHNSAKSIIEDLYLNPR